MNCLSPHINKIRALGDRCSFCTEPMLDCCFIEGGNNAEVKIVVNCCSAHVLEMDADSTVFEKKYAPVIDRLVAEARP